MADQRSADEVANNAYISNARNQTEPFVYSQVEPGGFDQASAHCLVPLSNAIHLQPGPQWDAQPQNDYGRSASNLSNFSIQPQSGPTAFIAPSAYMQQQFVPQHFAPYPPDPTCSPAYYFLSPHSLAYLPPQAIPPHLVHPPHVAHPPQFSHPPHFAHPQFCPQPFGPEPQPSDNSPFDQPQHIPYSAFALTREQEDFVRRSFEDPDDIYITSMRLCHISHRRYLRWINLTYHQSLVPQDFVNDWSDALHEMRRSFGHFFLPDIFVFNQFLVAVSANPDTRTWVDSLHIPMNLTLPPSIMEQLYRDFLVYEARRLNLPRSTWNPRNLAIHIPQQEMILRHYCPFHRILGDHHIEDCTLRPRRKDEIKPSSRGGMRDKR